MPNKAKHAFGSSSTVDSAIQAGKINARDILFLDEDTDSPKIGWIKKDGKAVILKDEKADLTELEAEVAKKVDAEEVDAKIGVAVQDTVTTVKAYTDGKIEAAVNEHLLKKYEILDVPDGSLVDYRADEIRILCPVDSEFVKQSVGATGDANVYYAAFRTYVPNDDVVGYIEHLGSQVDEEIQTTFSIDEYGRRYQTTWLGLARYDDATGWTYYGKTSSAEKYIGWDYQIDWYNSDGKMISSDSIRINLSNEDCHNIIKPYYVGSIMKEVDTKIDTKIEERISEVEASYEIVEF